MRKCGAVKNVVGKVGVGEVKGQRQPEEVTFKEAWGVRNLEHSRDRVSSIGWIKVSRARVWGVCIGGVIWGKGGQVVQVLGGPAACLETESPTDSWLGNNSLETMCGLLFFPLNSASLEVF